MCMIDDCDSAEVSSSRWIKSARKEHKCTECARPIAKGEPYKYGFMVFEGSGESYHMCQHCYVAAEWLIENCGGFVWHSVHEDIAEHASEYPALKEELQPLRDGMRAKWSGLLLPKLPASIQSTFVQTGELR